MLGRIQLPPAYREWNARWGAPHGRALPRWAALLPRRALLRDRLRGPFAFQANNTTRAFEYPWAFHAGGVERGQRVLEIGGALSGFQFALATGGVYVVNVDPFRDYGSEEAYSSDPEADLAHLNRVFRADVSLVRSTLPEAGLPDAAFDRVFTISTIEHLDERELEATLSAARRVLRPGGRMIVTADLFLDVAPFTSRSDNRFGRNVDMAALAAGSGMTLVEGDPRELHGFDDFDPDRVLSNLSEYLIGGYPALAQAMVLEKAS